MIGDRDHWDQRDDRDQRDDSDFSADSDFSSVSLVSSVSSVSFDTAEVTLTEGEDYIPYSCGYIKVYP